MTVTDGVECPKGHPTPSFFMPNLTMTKLVFVTNTTAAVSEVTRNDKPYLVSPVVAIREGVLNDILYLTGEFSRYPVTWELRPVPIGHPKRNGEYVSVNSPDIIDSEVTGDFRNIDIDSDRLKGEIWIDLEKAEKIGEPALAVVERLRAGEAIEVSTGLFADLEETSGEWNGKSYIGIARNIRPDHLALLPNEIGACSWDDGCGTPRVNQKGVGMGDDLKNNELTLDDRASLVRRAFWDQVADVDPDGWFLGDWDVVSVFDTTLIAKDWDTKNHSAFAYTITDEGNVTFGEPIAIEVVYRAEGNGAEVVIANQSVPTNMVGMFARVRQWLKAGKVEGASVHNKESKGMKKCDMVAALVANKQCKFSKEQLEAFDEKTLQTLQESLTANTQAEAAASATAETPAPTSNQGIDVAQLTQTIVATVKEQLAPALAAITANADRERAALVAQIVANSTLTEEQLKNMDTATLQALAQNFVPADYSGGAGFVPNSGGGNELEVLAMPKPTWVVANAATHAMSGVNTEAN